MTVEIAFWILVMAFAALAVGLGAYLALLGASADRIYVDETIKEELRNE